MPANDELQQSMKKKFQTKDLGINDGDGVGGAVVDVIVFLNHANCSATNLYVKSG